VNRKAKFDLSTIGSKLKALRDEHELSMRELAARANVAVSFISKIESGKTSPTVMTLQKILEAMDVAVVEFFSDDVKDSFSDNIIFKKKNMKALQDNDRKFFFTFPAEQGIKAVMTYEEYKPKTQVRELEWHKNDLCGFVIYGELTLDIPGRGIFKARKGDSFYLKGGTEHVAKNEDIRFLKMIVVELL
jgi:transcriptional regulator with XRE-family HTH domain